MYRPLMLSASALSQLSPRLPTEDWIRDSASRSVWRMERYYEPLPV